MAEEQEFGYQTEEEIAALPTFPEPETDETDGPASGPGYVYFVTESGYNFKVGRSVNPKRRRKSLQRERDGELKMKYVPVSNMLAAENRLLDAMRGRFTQEPGTTEWFYGNVAEAERVFTRNL